MSSSSQGSKRWLGLLKLCLVVGLITYVFTTIHWQDRYVQGELELTGDIIGHWDAQDVKFLVDGDSEPRTLAADAEVSPGMLTYWSNMHLGLFALGAFCFLVSLITAAIRWWWLLRVNRLDISRMDALRYTWIGLFCNNFVPGQTGGDLIKAIYVMKRCSGDRVAALMSVIVDRIMGLGSIALLAGLAVLFSLGEDNPNREDFFTLALAIWSVLGLVICLGVVAFSRRIRRLIRLSTLLRMLPGKFSHLLERVDQAVFFYRSHLLGMVMWLLAGMGNHVFSVLSYYFVGQALGVGMELADYFVLMPVILIVSAVPIAPNGWGVGEAMFGYLFGKFGTVHLVHAQAESIMRTRGVALSVLYRIHLTLWSLVGGLIMVFSKDKVSKEDIQAEVAQEELDEEQLLERSSDSDPAMQ